MFANRRHHPATRCRPVLEALEPRCLPSFLTSQFPITPPSPSFSTTADAITTGPDGNLYFGGTSAQGSTPALFTIGRVTPNGDVQIIIASNGIGEPNTVTAITTGPDGNLWFLASDQQQPAGTEIIGRINPAGNALSEFSPPTSQTRLGGITAGPDGNLWFTEEDANQIGRITPAGAVTEFPVPSASSLPLGIAPGPDGELWFTENAGNRIGRISPATGAITEFAMPSAQSLPQSITAGPDGNLWFTEAGANIFQIGRINPATGSISEFLVPPGSLPGASRIPGEITAGPDGALWFSIGPTGQGLGRITTGGSVTREDGDSPVALTAGPDGNLWYAAADSIFRINLHVTATGPDAGGGPDVRLFDSATGQQVAELAAYATAFEGGVRVAVGDVDGDGIPDIITAPGPSGGPDLRVFDGVTGSLIMEFMAYDPRFRGGVNVAAGDVNGAGVADIITAPDQGGGPDVRVWDGETGKLIQEFMAYNPAFLGGVRVAAGDVNGDGHADIITAPGVSGGPEIKVFDGASGAVLADFYAYDPHFLGGVYVAAGDVSGDGHADIVTSPGAGGGPDVGVFSGANFALTDEFAAYASSFQGGVRVAVVPDINGDGKADIVTAPGPNGGPDVRVFDGTTAELLDEYYAYSPNFLGGVFVGGA
jgi:streptogramin lyase